MTTLITCPACKGRGETLVDKSDPFSNNYDPNYLNPSLRDVDKWEICYRCNGEGMIEVLIEEEGK